MGVLADCVALSHCLDHVTTEGLWVRARAADALALRLGVTAADRDDRVWPLALTLGRVPHVRREPLVGLLADRARVEDEDVRFVWVNRFAEPELFERALDPLGIVGVHLAAER